jgi:hypothetical protein
VKLPEFYCDNYSLVRTEWQCPKFMTVDPNNSDTGEISGSHGGEYEHDYLSDVAPYSLVEADRRFRGAQCLHQRSDELSSCISLNIHHIYKCFKHNKCCTRR